jgi:hypothetical protein
LEALCGHPQGQLPAAIPGTLTTLSLTLTDSVEPPGFLAIGQILRALVCGRLWFRVHHSSSPGANDGGSQMPA